MKSATEYWKERFGEEPKSDNDKLMCAMMHEYAEHCKSHRLLRELRQMYLVNIDDGGQPKASIAEIMDLWDKVNRELQIVTID